MVYRHLLTDVSLAVLLAAPTLALQWPDPPRAQSRFVSEATEQTMTQSVASSGIHAERRARLVS